MANITVTNTFSNSTTADAAQVNANFTDIINGTSDGTKDFSISALTCAGAATLNGAVTLGNATADDITVTGSLASSIPIKTTNSYDIGSATISPRSVYLSDDGGAARSTRLLGATVAASWTFTFPTGAGTSRYRLETNGSGVTSWQPRRYSAEDVVNAGIAASVAASALTIALKGADGNDPSATNPVDIPFRSLTAATGTSTVRTATAALSVVISSGSTLGQASGQPEYIYVYALDNAGTIELAASTTRMFGAGSVQTTTAEGGVGGADSRTVLYSTTARTSVPIRLIGRIKSTQTTAGTWASAASEIAMISGFAPVQSRSEIRLDTSNGTGSTNTRIRRLTTVTTNTGSDMTLTQSAANGDIVTINTEGVYAVSYSDAFNLDDSVGLSVNSSQLTTNVESITAANRLAVVSTGGVSYQGSVHWTGRLYPGDVVRPHVGGNSTNGATNAALFHIFKIAD